MRIENILVRKINLFNRTDEKNNNHIITHLEYEVEGKSKNFRASIKQGESGWINQYRKARFINGELLKGRPVVDLTKSKEEYYSTPFVLKLEEGGKIIVSGVVLDLAPGYYEVKVQIEKCKDGIIWTNSKTKGSREPATLWQFGYVKEVSEAYGKNELEDSVEAESLLYQIRRQVLSNQDLLYLVYSYESIGQYKKDKIIDQEVIPITDTLSKKEVEDWILVQAQKFRKIKYEDLHPEITMFNNLILGEFSSTDCLQLLTEQSANHRNYLIDKVGFESFFETLKYDILSSNENEGLIVLKNGLKFLKHSNYCVAVPEALETVKQAVDWSFGLLEI